MNHEDAGIRISNVRKVFHVDPTPLLALDGVDLLSAPGSFLALIGPSGSGKSTIIRILADLEQPTEGEVSIHGRPPATLRRAHEIGVVFQDPALLPWRTVAENVRLGLELDGTRADSRALQDMLGLVGIADFARVRPAELSGGMKQRVALARALIVEPTLLLLDEPLAALDDLSRLDLNLELARIWSERRVTTLLATHSVREAVFLADAVALLSKRPGHIEGLIPIDLPRPRTPALLRTREFHTLCDLLTEHYLAETAAGGPP